MKNEELIKVIEQLKKYNLAKAFEDEENFKSWLTKLNTNQIQNFLSLNIEPDEVENILNILINEEILKCSDYNRRIEAISKLKNGEGCWHLFDNICNPNFLKSNNFYKDLELIAKADSARCALCVIGEDAFIESPFHDEDLKLIVETRDNNKKQRIDYIVSEALASVAKNTDSINSKYHQSDMKLMADCGSSCLQTSYSYPESSLNNLATNKVSLNDPFHLENMQILAKCPKANNYLYILMTDLSTINGEHYRKEINALINAKSENTARALYYYIINPKNKFRYDRKYHRDYESAYKDEEIYDNDLISGRNTPNYEENLITINSIPDEFVMHYISILMNSKLINNSPYLRYDLDLLKSISDKPIFMDLYRFITDETSINNPFHESDAKLLSETQQEKTRKLLLQKIIDEKSLTNSNREFDLEYISNLDLEKVDNDILERMYFYLFGYKGIDAPDHIQSLTKLKQGITVEPCDLVSSYIDTLHEKAIKETDDTYPLVEFASNKDDKPNILKFIRRWGRK